MILFYIIDGHTNEVVKIYKTRKSANAWIRQREKESEVRFYIQRVEHK